jgi:formamidopyrimidine-DNA glycosylase
MTGGFRFPEGAGRFEAPPRFERVRLVLDEGEVSFVDSRRLGTWRVVPRGEYEGMAGLLAMGPEPLEPGFTPEAFAREMARASKVKPALLSQRPVAGLGNIYADEALWLAGLHPEAAHLDADQSARLYDAIREVLGRAVETGGSTLSDASYRQPDGRPGSFQHEHRVYDREGEPCARCGGPILKYWLAGRGTHLCPTCQPRP